jgi:hypothetical protein
MKRTPTLITSLVLALLLALVAGLSVQLPQGAAHAQDPDQGAPAQGITAPEALVGTAFTYQGRLTDGGSPTTGEYDFRFRLHDDPTAHSPVAGLVTIEDQQVEQGHFTVQLDFGNVFTGAALYLEVIVRPGASTGPYTVLTPRQELTPAPYALALPGLWTQQNAESPNIIGGYRENSVGPGVRGAVIGGGGYESFPNAVLSDSYYATIGGGYSNGIGVDSLSSTVGGGRFNTIGDGSRHATVGGGSSNDIGDDSDYATIPGGRSNEANAQYAFAAGRRAKADHEGTFVWADSNDFDFASVVANTFRVRATGGARFVLAIDGSGEMTWSCGVNDGSTWSCSSDRNLKENLLRVDGDEVLRRLQEVPIYTWNGKGQDPAAPHMGPMAQDFYGAFGLGDSDTHIATIDLDGVALAAIQGLYAQNQELAAENAAQQVQIENLEARLAALERGGISRSSASGLPTWLLLGGLALAGGVVLRQSHRDCRAGASA